VVTGRFTPSLRCTTRMDNKHRIQRSKPPTGVNVQTRGNVLERTVQERRNVHMPKRQS